MTTWSPMDNAGNNGMKIGLDPSTSAVNSGSTSVTITFGGWTGNRYRYDDMGQTFVWSGAISGTDTYNNTQAANTETLRAVRSVTYTYPAGSYGTSPGNITVTARIGYSYNGSHPQVTVTVPIPARPVAIPGAPAAVRSSRVSDTQLSVAITPGSGTITSTTIERHQWSGTTGWSSFVTLATLSGAPTVWNDTTTQTNWLYAYRVRHNNGAGSSGWRDGNTSSTTPAAPTHLSSALSGTAIVTKWSNVVNYYPYDSHFVERTTDGGTSWSVIASGLAWNVTQYSDDPAPAGAVQYRVRSRSVDGGAGNPPLDGPYGVSNVVSTMVPPLAPTELVPNGTPADAAHPIVLVWKHNPGADFAGQTAYEVRWSADGGTTWTSTGTVTSTAATHTIPAATLTNGATFQWQVRTTATDPSAGPWSATATIIASSAPTVTLTGPPASVSSLPVVVTWAYNQDQSSPQASYEVTVLGDGGELGSWSVTSADATHTIVGVPLVDGVTYTARVRARSSAGLWSAWAETVFTIDLLPPAAVRLIPYWDCDSGTVAVGISVSDPVPGVSNPVDHVDVQRQVKDGPWVTIHPGVQPDSTPLVLDTQPQSNGSNAYRAVVVSISPSVAVTDTISIDTPSEWGFLSWGPGFTLIERGVGNPKLSTGADRDRALVKVGRRDPILLVGEGRSREVSVSMTLIWDCVDGTPGPSSTPEDLWRCAEDAETVLWRGWDGQRIYGLLKGLKVDQERPGVASASFSIVRTGWAEPDTVTV